VGLSDVGVDGARLFVACCSSGVMCRFVAPVCPDWSTGI